MIATGYQLRAIRSQGKPGSGARELHRPLDLVIQSIADPKRITSTDRALVLSAAFAHWEDLCQRLPDSAPGDLKMHVIDYLLASMPGLTANREAARILWNRGFAKWAKGGRTSEALKDGRFDRAPLPYHVCAECLKKIHDAAVRYHGRLRLAYRELRKRGQLHDDCMKQVKFDPRRDKSYMPDGLVKRTKPNKLTLAFARSPRDAVLIGPHCEGDYSGLRAGDVFVADDWTTNERVPVPQGDGRWEFYKVQVLVAADLRSAKALDLVMHFGHPLGWTIQRLWKQVYFDSVGMPRLGLHLERGCFKSALASQGSYENAFDLRHTLDVLGARSDPGEPAREVFANLRTVRARLPMAKTIEGELRNWQDRTSYLPGHLGFNERQDNHEITKDFMDLCRAGKADPRDKGLLTIDDLCSNYRRILEDYNGDENCGRRCRGLSPNEVWAWGVRERPLEKPPETLRYLFSTHRVRRPVTAAGIVIPRIDGFEDAQYYGERRLGELVGQTVEVFYNRLEPEFITVRVSAQESFVVRRQKYPRWGASKEQHHAREKARWNHLEPSKILAGNLSHPLSYTVVREDKFPASQLQMGLEHNVAVAQVESDRATEQAEIAGLRRRAWALGRPIQAGLNLHDPRVFAAVRLQIEAAEQKRKAACHGA